MSIENFKKSLDTLISSLSSNQIAQNYYLQVKAKVISIKKNRELIHLLEALCSSAKVKDVYGLENNQCEKWDRMWEEANKLRSILKK